MDMRSLLPFGRTFAPAAQDPFAAMRREMDRLMGDFGGAFPATGAMPAGFLNPKVDVAETDQGIDIHLDLPGIDPKDVNVELADGVLTIQAERKTAKEEKDDKKTWHVTERSYGTYMRRFALPFDVDSAKVEAAFDKGVLAIHIPRPPEVAPKTAKIAVKGG